jgi:excisionase family DNA binding protein
MHDKPFLSPADIASELSVSSATVLRLIHAGRLPAIRVSERIFRIPRATFELYKAGALQEPTLAPLRRKAGRRPGLNEGEELPRGREVGTSSTR